MRALPELLTNPIKLWLLLTDEVVGTVALIQLSDSKGPWHNIRNVWKFSDYQTLESKPKASP